MVLKLSLSVFLCISQLCFRFAEGQTVVACGGFVKGPNSMDFSRIEVRLFTVDGILKYQSFCAPHNGYFTVPVYNHGDYLLKLLPPVGWTFTPSQISLNIDGKTDICSKQEDINFLFAGFQLSGNVRNENNNDGPEGLRIELKPEASGVDIEPQMTTTDENGRFVFDGIQPGNYVISPIHLTWKFKQKEIRVTVASENVVAATIFVSGYEVTGSVVSSHGAASGVQLTLFSVEDASFAVPDCNVRDSSKLPIQPGFKPVCIVFSDTLGIFSFPPVPPGKYRIVPSFENEKTKFTVTPTIMDVDVVKSSCALKEPFTISGFSVSGKILFPSGYPAKDVVVFWNDEAVAKSNAQGIYTIDGMKSGNVRISFQAENAEFPDIHATISSEKTTLSENYASKVIACGKIVADPGTKEVVEVVAKNIVDGIDNAISVDVEKDNKFCIMLPSADYIFSVEKPVGKYRPHQVKVSLKAGPHFSISFEAFVAAVSGKVVCRDIDCVGIHLALYEIEEPEKLVPVGEQIMTSSGDFTFRNLHPGNYIVKASKHKFCFDPSEGVKFAIVDKDIFGLEIKHSGYGLILTSSHPIRLKFQHNDKDQKDEYNTVYGLVNSPEMSPVQVCLPKSGKYLVENVGLAGEPKWGCHLFSGSYPTEIDTNNLPSEINANALLHLVTITVHSSARVNTDDLYVGIKYIENSTIETMFLEQVGKYKGRIEEDVANINKKVNLREPLTTPLKKRERLYFDSKSEMEKLGNGTFTFQSAIFWYETELALEPKHPNLIFKPKRIEVYIDAHSRKCPTFAAFFTGHEAKVIKGKVTPPTAGVRVIFTNKKDPADKHIVWTEADGSYTLGPLDPNDEYNIDAEIEGWEIQPAPNNPGNFLAKRLGSIDVSVSDDKGNILNGVLISISGPNHFRNNSLTNEDGKLYLGSLAEGQYYAQAFRKEYSFEPRNLLVPLNPGESATIKFVGKRVAYSCYGSIASLNGEPEQEVSVVARSLDCSDAPGEEASTDSEGNFRLLGLFPGCSYSITLRPSDQIDRTVPSRGIIKVDKNDIHDVKLWTVRSPPPQLLITARLQGPVEYLNSIQVLLMNSETGAIIHSFVPSSQLVSFPLMPFPAGHSLTSLSIKLETANNFQINLFKFSAGFVELGTIESEFVHAVLKYEVVKKVGLADGDSPISLLIQPKNFGSVIFAVFFLSTFGLGFIYMSADRATQDAIADRLKTLVTNPSGFLKEMLSGSSSPSYSQANLKLDKTGGTGVIKKSFKQSETLRRSPSIESLSSTSSSSPQSDNVQPRKRVARPRLQ